MQIEFAAMIRLTKSLKAWRTPAFQDVLKDELEALDATVMPLQQGLAQSSYAVGGKFNVMIISVSKRPGFIRAKAGIFYTGLIPGCSCADDPTPVNEYSEYCQVQIDINQETAETDVKLLPE